MCAKMRQNATFIYSTKRKLPGGYISHSCLPRNRRGWVSPVELANGRATPKTHATSMRQCLDINYWFSMVRCAKKLLNATMRHWDIEHLNHPPVTSQKFLLACQCTKNLVGGWNQLTLWFKLMFNSPAKSLQGFRVTGGSTGANQHTMSAKK